MGFLSGIFGSNSSYQANSGLNDYANQADDAQAQQALLQQQRFADATAQSGGLANQSSVFNQLQGVANGQGPNPAQAMLANATGQNVQQQAALQAGQRGASQNAGLIARQAGMQGANIQQQAVGQGAALQANQSLNAMGQLGGIANQQVAQQQNALGQYNQAAQNMRGQNLQAIGGSNQINADTAKTNAANNSGIAGKIIGGAASALALASGGMIPHLAEGGFTNNFGNAIDQRLNFNSTNPNAFGDGMGDLKTRDKSDQSIAQMGGPTEVVGATGEADLGSSPFGMMAAHGGLIHAYAGGGEVNDKPYGHYLKLASGGKVPALVSPGERYLPPNEAVKVAQGKKDAMQAGQKIPGKAKVGGAKNDYANDTVPAKLDEGGIVIPRSITQGKDASKNAAAFVEAVLAQSKLHSKR